MSWRVSFYKADKKQPLIIKEDDNPEYPEIEINGVQIINNEGTKVWQYDITEEEKNNPELFVKLRDDFDCDYYEFKKKGLELFIRKYEELIINDFKELYNTPEEDDPKEHFKRYLRRKVWEWGQHLTIEKDLDKDQYRVNNSDWFEYTIFNLIHLYKTFDFDNYCLVLWGG